MDLHDRTAVILGGTHGMGLATARELIERGARVIVTGASAANVERARSGLTGAIDVIQSDISSVAATDALAARVGEALGPIDALFLFAGVAELAHHEEVMEASYDRQFGINARGAFFALQRFAPLMRDGGAIVVATVTPSTATPGLSVYTGTKAALLAFARGLAAELLPRRIRVNAVAPGFIDTPTLGLPGISPEDRETFAREGDEATPMKRHGTMQEVARAALFLAFDATFTTGVELPVDGGISTVDAA